MGFGISGGSGAGLVGAGGANSVPVIQANFDKSRFKTHIFNGVLSVKFIDLQRSEFIGRPLENILQQGMRKAYDKHLDQNCYTGFETYGTYGLLNNPNVIVTAVQEAGANNETSWGKKTADEILADVNSAIISVWNTAENSRDAIPNHILIPYEQYNIIATKKVGEHGDKSILTYLLENNIATKNGTDLYIGATAWCKGAGAGGRPIQLLYGQSFVCLPVERVVVGLTARFVLIKGQSQTLPLNQLHPAKKADIQPPKLVLRA